MKEFRSFTKEIVSIASVSAMLSHSITCICLEQLIPDN
jgi:hypothetical protein